VRRGIGHRRLYGRAAQFIVSTPKELAHGWIVLATCQDNLTLVSFVYEDDADWRTEEQVFPGPGTGQKWRTDRDFLWKEQRERGGDCAVFRV